MKHIFVLNDKFVRYYDVLKDSCGELGYNFEIILSNSKEMATDIAKVYKDDICIVYAVGGDGTMNAVLNGLVGGWSMLGVIPLGKDNDFYKSLELQTRSYITDCNVIKVNDTYGLNDFSLGIEAQIYADFYGENMPTIQAILTYFSKIYLKRLGNPSLKLKIDINGDSFYIRLLTIFNGKYYCGRLLEPRADIAVVGAPISIITDSNIKNLWSLMKNMDKNSSEGNIALSIDDKYCEVIKYGKFVNISVSENIIGYVDGEKICSDFFSIDTSAERIKVAHNLKLIRHMKKKQ